MLALVRDDDLRELEKLSTESPRVERRRVEPCLELLEPEHGVEDANVGRRRRGAASARASRERAADSQSASDECRAASDVWCRHAQSDRRTAQGRLSPGRGERLTSLTT